MPDDGVKFQHYVHIAVPREVRIVVVGTLEVEIVRYFMGHR